MGISTDAQLSFGYSFEDGFEFPWSDDFEEWWRQVNGFKPSIELYDTDGDFLNGHTPSNKKIDQFYDEIRKWDENNPCPVELQYHCSLANPMYILAVPSSTRVANRGYPQEINPSELVVTEEQIKALKNFCEKYEIETSGEPKWWLSSMWQVCGSK